MQINNSTYDIEVTNWTSHISPEAQSKHERSILFWERAKIVTVIALCVIGVSLVAAPFLLPASLLSSYMLTLEITVFLGVNCISYALDHLDKQKEIAEHLAKKTKDLSIIHQKLSIPEARAETVSNTLGTVYSNISLHNQDLLVQNLQTKLSIPILTHILYQTEQIALLNKELHEKKAEIEAPLKIFLNSLCSQLQEKIDKTMPSLTALKITEDTETYLTHLEDWKNIFQFTADTLPSKSNLHADIAHLNTYITLFEDIQSQTLLPSLKKHIDSLLGEMKEKHKTWKSAITSLNEDKENQFHANKYKQIHELKEKIVAATVSKLFLCTILLQSTDTLAACFQTGTNKHGANLENILYDFAKKKPTSITELAIAAQEEGLDDIPLLLLPDSVSIDGKKTPNLPITRRYISDPLLIEEFATKTLKAITPTSKPKPVTAKPTQKPIRLQKKPEKELRVHDGITYLRQPAFPNALPVRNGDQCYLPYGNGMFGECKFSE